MNYDKISSVKRYVRNLTWLGADALSRLSGLMARAVFLGISGIAIQAVTFLLFIAYLQKMDAGADESITIPLFEYSITNLKTFDFVLLLSLGLLVLLALSEVAIFFSRKTVLNINRMYSEFCSKRLITKISDSDTYISKHKLELHSETYILRSGMKDSRSCGIVLRKLLDSFVPALTAIVAFGILLYLNATLTIFVLLLLLGYVLIQARISRKAAGYAVLAERAGPPARKRYKSLISQAKASELELDEVNDLLDFEYQKGPLKNSLDAYVNRILVISGSRFITGLFTVLVFVSFFFFMVQGVENEKIQWHNILIYLIALRFALVNVKTLFVHVTAVNRMYPGVVRYVDLLNELVVNTVYGSSEVMLLKRGENDRVQGDEDIQVNYGSRLAVVTTLDLARYSVKGLWEVIWGDQIRCPKIEMVSDKEWLIGRSLESVFDMPSGAGWEMLNIPDSMLDDLKKHLPKRFDSRINKSRYSDIPDVVKILLSFVKAQRRDSTWLAINHSDLACLEKNYPEVRGMLCEKILMIFYKQKTVNLGRYGETAVVVSSDSTRIGSGSIQWFKQNHDEINAFLNKETSKVESVPDDVTDDEDEFD